MDNLESFIGKKLELEIINNLGKNTGEIYLSQLLDVYNDGHIEISAPINEGRFKLIYTDTKVRVVLNTENFGILSFMSKVISNKKGSSSSIYLLVTGKLEPVQRRGYFRLEQTLDLKYSIHANKDHLEICSLPIKPPPKKSKTKNISGNGLLILMTEKLDKGELLDVELIFSNTIVKILVQVTYCCTSENVFYKYQAGVKFLKISKKDQDFLVRFIFETQRKRIKRAD